MLASIRYAHPSQVSGLWGSVSAVKPCTYSRRSSGASRRMRRSGGMTTRRTLTRVYRSSRNLPRRTSPERSLFVEKTNRPGNRRVSLSPAVDRGRRAGPLKVVRERIERRLGKPGEEELYWRDDGDDEEE